MLRTRVNLALWTILEKFNIRILIVAKHSVNCRIEIMLGIRVNFAVWVILERVMELAK